MAIDLGIGDLIGSLFFGGADAAAADVGAGAAVDALGGGADALAAGAAGAGADVLGGGADALAAGAAGAGADALAGGADALAGGGLDALAGGGLDLAGGPATISDTLEFAPSTAGGTGTGILGAGAPATGAGADSAGAAADVAAVTSPATEAAGAPNINAALGLPDETPVTGAGTGGGAGAGGGGGDASTVTTALGNQTVPNSDLVNLSGSSAPTGTDALTVGDALSTAGTSPSAGALSSVESGTSSFLNSPITKLAELGLPLGFLGYNLLKGPAPIPSQAQTAVNNAENQLTPLQGQAQANVPLFNQTAATDLSQATAFQISPAQAASISQWQQQQYNQLYQQIANQGNANPTQTSEWAQGKNQIDQQALAQQVQMVNQLISTAFQSASAANAGVSTATNVTSSLDATLMQAAQLQVQQDAAFNSAIGSALQSFGMLAALSSLGSKSAGTGTTSTV